MTIERASGLAEMHCDDCGQASFGPHDHRDIDVLRDEARRAGWKTFKRDGKWCNACPACVADYARTQSEQGGFVL